ncbi:hypothetical protein ABE527_02350 [Brucella sp. TWI432]
MTIEDNEDANDILQPEAEPLAPAELVEPDPLPLEMELFTPEEKFSFLRDLKTAYYLGATRVKFRERDVSYRNREDMKAIIDQLEAEVFPKKRRSRSVFTTFRKGY